MNFTRGFRQWAYVRGQAKDRYAATNHADEGLLARYRGNKDLIKAHLVNVQLQQARGDLANGAHVQIRYCVRGTKLQPYPFLPLC